MPRRNKTREEHAAYMRAWYRKNREIVLARKKARCHGLPLPPKRPTVNADRRAICDAMTAAAHERRQAQNERNRLQREKSKEHRKWIPKKLLETARNRAQLLKGTPVEVLPMRIALYEFRSMTSGRLTEDDVVAIRASEATYREMAAAYGVSTSAIGLIRRGVNWKHVIAENQS